MRVAVVGAGISGLASAYILAKAGVEVVLYEKEKYLGGQAKTLTIDGVDLDLGSMVFNPATYPNMIELFENLGVEMEVVDMSFSVILEKGHSCEWGNWNGLSSLFAQKKNVWNLYFWQMLREIMKFKDDVLRYLEELENSIDIDRNETLGDFIKSHGYSVLFQKAYIVPICASMWSCHSEGVMSISAYLALSFFRNNHLLQLFGCPQLFTVKGGSHNYVNKVREGLERRGCQIRSGCKVDSITTVDDGCFVIREDGLEEKYDGCLMAVNASDALKLLCEQATYDESRILGAFHYVYSDIFLHRDKKLMPKNPVMWSAWNFLGTVDDKVCLTYWLNMLQNNEDKRLPYLVTVNPSHMPEDTLLKWSSSHMVPSVAASKASLELDNIQGKRGIWFSGVYKSYVFHEDRLKAGVVAAHDMLKKSYDTLNSPKHLVPSLIETGARLFVTRFLRSYIASGSLILLEDGGSVFTFQGTKKSSQKVYLKVHNPQFYWKVFLEAELGFADAYINGDISFVNKNEGLLNLFMMVIDSKILKATTSNLGNKRIWSMLLTAGITSAKYSFRHALRRNSVAQARRNISRHYDLSNDLFALFLDETMTYSCAIFKGEDEDLKVAQLRKLFVLIEKARIDKEHEILDIGCGWGSLAIEVVKKTGCKYTGITLSEEQLTYAQMKVKEAGLQDHITFLLCDYRELPRGHKYDRIISIGMIEAVGHEYMEEFFGCCESLLAEDGLFVLQFISIPDEWYDEYRRSAGFIKEYIFPGGCLPSLSRITSAMAGASRLCVEHVENIGIHYYQTLRCWRKNFIQKQSEILALGFDDKFIRKWEYYFDYCAAGFKTRTLGDYQVVFSRLGNVAAFDDPYKGIASAYDCNF